MRNIASSALLVRFSANPRKRSRLLVPLAMLDVFNLVTIATLNMKTANYFVNISQILSEYFAIY
ncbi:MAG TPA: hypothetical protein VJS63_03235 [Bradyrhizobium sp.]|nr:hypothetical protein [Bradyrhizobium sp.]